MIDRLIARAFKLRDASHLAHWAAKGTGSYSRHMALGDLYESIIESLDEIVEVYQGTHGLITVNYESAKIEPDKILDAILGEAEWVAANKAAIANGSPSVANLLDEYHGTLARTAYKLKNLQ